MSAPSSSQLELEYTRRLLACFIFELQVNWVEKDIQSDDPPDAAVTLDRLEELIKHVPPAVKPLVEHLRRNIPEEHQGELYTYSFPFVTITVDGSLK